MPLRLGSSAVSLRLGTQSVTGYLGTQLVTVGVPGAPVITSAVDYDGSTSIFYTPPGSDGGSEINDYVVYVNGVGTPIDHSSEGEFIIYSGLTGQQVQLSAVNSVGEGPKSAQFTVTAG